MSEFALEQPGFERGLRQARAILDRLSVGEGLAPPGFERGLCGECCAVVLWRWRHGRFGNREGESKEEVSFCRLPLCRTCKRSRLVIAEKAARPLPELSEQERYVAMAVGVKAA